jgi:hypothetical protein
MRMSVRHVLVAAILAVLTQICAALSSGAQVKAAPKLYFYPAPYRLSNGTLSPSILTIAPEQITTLFPEIREMEGVVLLVSWAQVCPVRAACNFTLIDEVLDYWKLRNKKVILSLSTMGLPVKIMLDGHESFMEETPAWVLHDVATYSAHLRTIGVIEGMDVSATGSHIDAVLPSPFDPNFLRDVSLLVKQIAAKYDGNPAISYVRIATGSMGEDNPIPPTGAGLVADQEIPGFTVSKWIEYCEKITSIYVDAFRRSQLEFDISFIPSAYGKIATSGERAHTDKFLQLLDDKHILVGFNGLESADLEYLRETSGPGPVYALAFLHKHKMRGRQIGLEAIGPIASNPRIQDLSAVSETLKEIGADRLVLFGIDAGAINFARNGANPANASSVQFITKQGKSVEATGHQVEHLLELVGY